MNVIDSEIEREKERERETKNERARERHLLADITDSDIVRGQ